MTIFVVDRHLSCRWLTPARELTVPQFLEGVRPALVIQVDGTFFDYLGGDRCRAGAGRNAAPGKGKQRIRGRAIEQTSNAHKSGASQLIALPAKAPFGLPTTFRFVFILPCTSLVRDAGRISSAIFAVTARLVFADQDFV